MDCKQNRMAYYALLVIQTGCAASLIWLVFPLFRQIVILPGEPQVIPLSLVMSIAFGALVLNLAYFARYHRVAVPAPFRSVFAGHLVQFAGRISFFFGGALFSALFFRHFPEFESISEIEQILLKATFVLWVLFSLFCYSLELDRLGRAIEVGILPTDQ